MLGKCWLKYAVLCAGIDSQHQSMSAIEDDRRKLALAAAQLGLDISRTGKKQAIACMTSHLNAISRQLVVEQVPCRLPSNNISDVVHLGKCLYYVEHDYPNSVLIYELNLETHMVSEVSPNEES